MCNECMHGTCQVTVHLCLLLQGDGTGVSEDHSTTTSSCSTAAVNQRDDTAMSSSSNGCSYEDECSAPLMPLSFTRVGGPPHWGETSARTDLSYIHPQTAKYQMKATVRPKEKVGWACRSCKGRGSWQHDALALVKHIASTIVILVRLPYASTR